MDDITTIKRKATAGMNAFKCPICRAMKLNSTVFIPVSLVEWAYIQVNHALVKKGIGLHCGHKVEVTLEAPERVDGRYLLRRERWINAR